jgi:hypothetical protein
METELCPICISREAEYITECNHGYCIECLCKLKKCALCRKTLQKTLLCNQIRKPGELNITSNYHRNRTIQNTIYNSHHSSSRTSSSNISGIHPWHLKTRRMPISRTNINNNRRNRFSFLGYIKNLIK